MFFNEAQTALNLHPVTEGEKLARHLQGTYHCALQLLEADVIDRDEARELLKIKEILELVKKA